MLSLTPRANADDATITGKLSLASLADPDPSLCGSTSGWASWYEARLFANGNVVYVVVPVYWYDQNASGGKVVVAAIDVSNPAAPVLASKADMLLTPHVQGGTSYFYAPGGYAFWDGYDYYSFYGGVSGSVVGTGDGVVQLGSKLAYLEVYYESTPTVVLAGGQKDY